LNKPEHLIALALSALNGGARGLRLEGIANIQYARKKTNVPIIGLVKSEQVQDQERLSKIYITSTFAEAQELAKAGADIIALDATDRPRPDGLSLKGTIERIHKELNKPVWADISTLEDGIQAAEAGADVISTTLAGYTKETYVPPNSPPDLSLLANLIKSVKVPVVLEGHVWHPDEVRKAFELGAFSVVVGSAITRPQLITQRFVSVIPELAEFW
jgi:N-acylglucosamine-6-phosphate 2-epimerase